MDVSAVSVSGAAEAVSVVVLLPKLGFVLKKMAALEDLKVGL